MLDNSYAKFSMFLPFSPKLSFVHRLTANQTRGGFLLVLLGRGFEDRDMASGLESEAVFTARASQLGVTAAQLAGFAAANINTLGQLAYGCSFQPGMPDEAPLAKLAEEIYGAPLSLGSMSIFRRLYYEAHTVALLDMRGRMEHNTDEAPKKILAPEREARHLAQQHRLRGVSLEAEMQPSHILVDKCIAQYDSNELRYIQIDECATRAQELMGTKKTFDAVKVDANKNLRLSTESAEVVANISSDLMVRNALMRRALAYDLAALITFSVQEKWILKLFRLMAAVPLSGFRAISMEQCLRADQQLFISMQEATRATIVPAHGGARPLDLTMEKFSDHQEVNYLLSPIQSTSGKGQRTWPAETPYDRPGQKGNTKGRGKGSASPKGKGKKGRKGKAGRRSAIQEGQCVGRTPDGRYICYSFNSTAGCQNDATSGSCARGHHICGKAGCHGDHSLQQCTR